MTGKFSPSVPRVMHWGDVQKARGEWVCPECGSALEKDPQTYVLGVRADGRTQAAMVSNSGGYFCADCPVVVLDRTVFGQYAVKAFPKVGDVSSFTVAGIVNRETADGKPALVAFADPAERASAVPAGAAPEGTEARQAPLPASEPEPAPVKAAVKAPAAPKPAAPGAAVAVSRSFAPVREEQVKSSHRPKNRKKLRRR